MSKKEVKTDGWLATYADTVTLLLTFFVLLYSFSTVDAAKFRQISTSFQSMFTGKAANSMLEFNVASGEVPVVGKPEQTTETKDPNKEIYEDITEFIQQNNLQNEVTVYENYKGINIELKEAILFDTGKAHLRDDSVGVLSKINEIIGKVSAKVIVEGHTDNLPIKTEQFPSNWHLSSARAMSVLDYFLVTKGQKNPERFSAQAYGEYSPIAPNDSAEHRAMNRRVNIIILSGKKE
jgi:chemotaxis protein MotB